MKRFYALATQAALLLIIFTWGCGSKTGDIEETPTRGNIRIAADESFYPLIDTEIKTFHSLYTYATIRSAYKPESEVIADLLNDSVRAVVVTRQLTQQENDLLKAKSFVARSTKIAYDAVAFILNKSNQDTNLLYNQIGDIIGGKLTNWQQISKKSGLGEIVVVFDNNKSGNFRFLKDKFLKDQQPSKNLFAVKSNEEVLQYVKDKPNAIGVIGVNWLSDKHDSTSYHFMKEVKIASIGNVNDPDGIGDFKKPYQGYIADGTYPFCREVYVICRESFAGLGTGFASFMAGDAGQRIVLKSGLVPATMPVRLIEVNK